MAWNLGEKRARTRARDDEGAEGEQIEFDGYQSNYVRFTTINNTFADASNSMASLLFIIQI